MFQAGSAEAASSVMWERSPNFPQRDVKNGSLWLAIRRLFEANKAPRAIFLGHEFYLMTQGDSSVNDYA